MTTLVLVRRVEALLLLVLAASLALLDDGSMVVDVVLIAIALVLLCQNLRARPKPEITRQIDDLLDEGLRVHSGYVSAKKLRSWPKTKELSLARYETEKWVDRTRVLLRPYPEFAGIFEARQSGATPADEVANRIRRLHEIKSLLVLSKRVGLRRD
jgi:hypothetical protein